MHEKRIYVELYAIILNVVCSGFVVLYIQTVFVLSCIDRIDLTLPIKRYRAVGELGCGLGAGFQSFTNILLCWQI